MNQKQPYNYIIPKPENITLKQRLENVRNLKISDDRSVESRIRDIAFCKLEQFYPYDNREKMLKTISKCCSCNITENHTYCEVATKIYNLFENGNPKIATLFMLRLLKPIFELGKEAYGIPRKALLKNQAYRKYATYLDDYNRVIDMMFPELAESFLDSYRYSFDLQTYSILDISYLIWKYIEDFKNELKISRDANEKSKSHAQNSIQMPQYEIVKRKASIFLLKEIFIDPFHYLFMEEYTKNPKI